MTCARVRRKQSEMCEELESVAGSHDPENPPFDSGDFSLLRRQRRIEETREGINLVCPSQPRCHGEGGLLIAVAAILWESARPQ